MKERNIRLSVWQTRAKVAFLFLIQGLYIRDFMDPTAWRRASPWRTLPNTFAASLLAKYADRSPLLTRVFPRPTAAIAFPFPAFWGFRLACFTSQTTTFLFYALNQSPPPKTKLFSFFTIHFLFITHYPPKIK